MDFMLTIALYHAHDYGDFECLSTWIRWVDSLSNIETISVHIRIHELLIAVDSSE